MFTLMFIFKKYFDPKPNAEKPKHKGHFPYNLVYVFNI